MSTGHRGPPPHPSSCHQHGCLCPRASFAVSSGATLAKRAGMLVMMNPTALVAPCASGASHLPTPLNVLIEMVFAGQVPGAGNKASTSRVKPSVSACTSGLGDMSSVTLQPWQGRRWHTVCGKTRPCTAAPIRRPQRHCIDMPLALCACFTAQHHLAAGAPSFIRAPGSCLLQQASKCREQQHYCQKLAQAHLAAAAACQPYTYARCLPVHAHTHARTTYGLTSSSCI